MRPRDKHSLTPPERSDMTVGSSNWTDLTEEAIAVDADWMALGNERFPVEGATFIRNPDVSLIRDANHGRDISAATPEDIDRLLARAESEFQGFPARTYRVDYDTPPAFEARLALEGYLRSESLIMLLEGEPHGSPSPADIRPVASESGWQAYARLKEIDWHETMEKNGRPFSDVEDRAVREMVRSYRAKCPPVRYWLAWDEGRPRAFLACWEGARGVGQVEDLFTHPDYRRRGLAAALLHHCIADCRSRGARAMMIAADPADTPKHIYAGLGFRPVAVQRVYWKRVQP